MAATYDNEGTPGNGMSVLLNTTLPTSVANEPTGAPEHLELEQNFSNPFNPTTIFSCALPVASDVRLVVYDLLGREVAALVNGEKVAGSCNMKFDASNLSIGIYIYKLISGVPSRSKRRYS